MISPVVIAGGTGSRLWPLSRQRNPKQFLKLCGELTLLQQSLSRLIGLETTSPAIICNEQHRFIVAEQVRQLSVKDATILLEPVDRNTAPAIALAALNATRNGQDPILLVLAADHFISDQCAFKRAVLKAEKLAEQSKLVTFGIVPTLPETGYGYIQRGDALLQEGYAVVRFVEKPDVATAKAYLDSKDYYWNSGMFMFKASVYLDALAEFQPDILGACKAALENGQQDTDFLQVDAGVFAQCAESSIDYAVLEKASAAAVVPLDADWSDIDSWFALWEIGDKDADGNVCKGDVLAQNTRGSLIYAEHKLVATVGVENLVVVETKDAVLVAHKDKAQDVKNVVKAIKNDGRHEHMNHREVYRPWGAYDSIDISKRYQVKCIKVKPGAKLSVQMHHHRAEHWIVVSGTAMVTVDDEQYLVTENQSTYIPVGQVHCLENPGVIPLELIEVQSGSYLGEDDIVRLKDLYGRV
ncbi:mannose-1-phosphate guanylyltransferase/mannose-6-phosphate isomerase [Marinobacter sp. 1_MG-2023]|uniref:mannose-1-phosphate guanylyltransferase/mannose-6-phosphate isomerase n=1 Tax=Marinobacter sp. 1_MG-2023 TaxID=3062627 RepID=UPI0026E28757|nr:mannose-1-phosphate guanylyltransferase/mannose-6-phosphate isomerase [Marinobacter sp. 1_MG-2023]MDO6823306.1 mannose-1-phosphate guanylyltransferase/mannose-6-phosphate isomerase [Marinobacter sp. 1_MG-2023]